MTHTTPVPNPLQSAQLSSQLEPVPTTPPPAPQYAPALPQYAQPAQNGPQAVYMTRPDGGRKSLGVAYLLLLILGLLGVHYFYLGLPGRGILRMLTFGGCGILWVIDLFALPSAVRRVNTGNL